MHACPTKSMERRRTEGKRGEQEGSWQRGGARRERRRRAGVTLAILYERHAITTPRARPSVARQTRKAAPNGSTSAAAGMNPPCCPGCSAQPGARAWRSKPEPTRVKAHRPSAASTSNEWTLDPRPILLSGGACAGRKRGRARPGSDSSSQGTQNCKVKKSDTTA